MKPLVPRYLRVGVAERLDRRGRTVMPLAVDDVQRAIDLLRQEGVSAVAICFMNSFANPAHEQAAAEMVRRELPDAFLTTSTELLPAIRFYDRVSTTALNAYVGSEPRPLPGAAADEPPRRRLRRRMLLIMQSNGGVISPARGAPRSRR